MKKMSAVGALKQIQGCGSLVEVSANSIECVE